MKPIVAPTAVLAGYLLFFVVSSSAQVTIDTTPSWNGSDNVYPFGLPYTATYGQTVTVPDSASVLTSFSFEMNLPSTETFQGYVFAWDGAEASGSPLYSSPVMSTSGSGFEEITFNTGDLLLNAGASYVLFASTSQTPNSGGTGSWGQPGNSDVYPGGAFVYLSNGTDTALWTTTPWTQGYLGCGGDLAFKATFVPVPEPSPFALGVLWPLSLLLRRSGSARR